MYGSTPRGVGGGEQKVRDRDPGRASWVERKVYSKRSVARDSNLNPVQSSVYFFILDFQVFLLHYRQFYF